MIFSHISEKSILDVCDLQALIQHCIKNRHESVMGIPPWSLSWESPHGLFQGFQKSPSSRGQRSYKIDWEKTVLWSDESRFEIRFRKHRCFLQRETIRIFICAPLKGCVSDGVGMHHTHGFAAESYVEISHLLFHLDVFFRGGLYNFTKITAAWLCAELACLLSWPFTFLKHLEHHETKLWHSC